MQKCSFIPPMQNQALQTLTTDKQTTPDVHVTETQGQPYYVQDVPLTLYLQWLRMHWTPTNRFQIAAWWVTSDDPASRTTGIKSDNPFGRTRDFRSFCPYRLPASPQQIVDQVNALYDILRLYYQVHYL